MALLAAAIYFFFPIIELKQRIHLTASDLQAQIASKFPLEKHALILTARFTDPQVTLNSGSNRLGLGITTTVEAPGHKLLSGRTEADGEISYNAETGELFLNNPKVTKLHVDGLPREYEGIARSLVGSVLEGYLAKMPIYKLDRSDTRQALAKIIVKSVKVEDGELVIEFGL